MTLLPPDLASRFKDIFSPEEMDALWKVFSFTKRQTTLRSNTLKTSSEKIEQTLRENNIAFTKLDFPKNCYLLDSNFSEKDLWELDIYKNGDIYIQGISSQIPVHMFQSDLSQFSPYKGEMKSPLKILDACAAPGGKTSQIAELYPDAEIWAFEPHKIRFDKMNYNLEKLGCKNVKTIQDSVENIWNYISDLEYFDLILIDAPCSGEGWILYNNTKFLELWDIKYIKKNYARQKSICDSVLPYLKTWWETIYSTCTIAPEENEWVVHYLLCKYPELQLQKLDIWKNKYINSAPALKHFEKYFFKKEISEHCVRVIPSEFSEWFFIGKFKKCLN